MESKEVLENQKLIQEDLEKITKAQERLAKENERLTSELKMAKCNEGLRQFESTTYKNNYTDLKIKYVALLKQKNNSPKEPSDSDSVLSSIVNFFTPNKDTNIK